MKYLRIIWRLKYVIPPAIAILCVLWLTAYYWMTGWWMREKIVTVPHINFVRTAQAKELTPEEYICTKRWDCKIAKAIFKAESGFYAYAINKNNDKGGTLDLGCAQLNEKWQMKPKGITRKQAFDCKFSIDIAYQIYVEWGHTFNAWSSYKNGSYKKFVN